MKNDNRKYYEAYEERYKVAHGHGVSWASDVCSPIVLEILSKYGIPKDKQLLEIGCGEGRDAFAVLSAGYNLLATDISKEAIAYCKAKCPQFEENFQVLDCLAGQMEAQFDFIYAVAVVHMLVLDADRDGFYRFVRSHLRKDGLALICSMGDGETEFQTDISRAFTLQERSHASGKMMVAGTSCRMVSFRTFEAELQRNGLRIVGKGFTSAMPDFDRLLYAVVRKEEL